MQLPLAKARGRGAELYAQVGGRTSIDFSGEKWGNDRYSKTSWTAVETGRMKGALKQGPLWAKCGAREVEDERVSTIVDTLGGKQEK